MSNTGLTTTALRVLIVDPHEVSRAAIRALLQTEGLEVVADVANGEAALALADEVSPDIVIIDIGQDARPALEVARAVVQLRTLPTVVLTSSSPLQAGLGGYPCVAKPDLCARELRIAMRSRDTET